MFGVSFTELLLIGAIALLVVGPQRLPKLLGTLGRWASKLRRITSEVRYQSGIDEMLRKEGLAGGLNELKQLRGMAKGQWSSLASSVVPAAGALAQNKPPPGATASKPPTTVPVPTNTPDDPFADVPYDRSREYPTEGPDAQGALPDDLWMEPAPRP